MKRDIIFDIGKFGKIKGKIFVKQLTPTDFTAMVTFEYPDNLESNLKELLDCAQCPHKGSTMQEAMKKAYDSTKTLLRRKFDSMKEFEL